METRNLHIKICNDQTGEVIYEHPAFNGPALWSDTAITILASRYAKPGENSVHDVVDRIANRITSWMVDQNYIQEDSTTFATTSNPYHVREQLYNILTDQRAAFNTPIWVNLDSEREMCAACFLADVEDNMNSIMDHTKVASMIYKNSAGVGLNISNLRGKGEALSSGGESSGPVSFMRVWDRAAGAVKSGGKTRRAAALITMDVDHPDVEEFIKCKSAEEKKAKVLIAAGISRDEAYSTVDFQNANHSIGISDVFMEAVKEDKNWFLLKRAANPEANDGGISKIVKARELFRLIAQSAWETGDPGLQFLDTVNRYNPVPSLGKIKNSNPCFTGDMYLLTDGGYKTFESLCGKSIKVCSLLGTYSESIVWCSGVKPVYKIEFCDTAVPDITCTADHVFLTSTGEECKAIDLLGKTLKQYNSRPLDSTQNDLKVRCILYIGEHPVYDFTEPVTHFGVVSSDATCGVIAHNCGEIYGIPWSSCLLCSFNLVKYLLKTETSSYKIDYATLRSDLRIVTFAMDAMIDKAYYPDERFAEVAKKTRPLGIGISNLGGALALLGLPYDSDEGRKWAADTMAFILACVKGASNELVTEYGFAEIDCMNSQMRDSYGGYRNSQFTCIAPTGTVGLIMDCDSTGCEPIFARKTTKKLIDGSIIESVPRCLQQAQYPERTWTANEIHWKDHIKMVAALQPYISGGISKTINMPNNATVEEIEEAFMMAHDFGLKGITVYRDGSKSWQPLNETIEEDLLEEEDEDEDIEQDKTEWTAIQRKVPDEISLVRHKFNISGVKGYIKAGTYPDTDSVCEVWLKVSKSGSLINGLLDSLAIVWSLALQYGVPLEKLVDNLSSVKFEPSGWTTNSEIPSCSSIVDYVCKWLELKFISRDKPILIEATESKFVQEQPEVIVLDGPLCQYCGNATRRSGTCFLCCVCGRDTGCGG